MYFIKNEVLLVLIFALIFQACEESVMWETPVDTEAQLVVEAILTDENIIQEIKLSQSYVELNGEAPAVTDAEICLIADGNEYSFIADTSRPGIYKSKDTFAVIADLEYVLTIHWAEKEYSASSQLSTVAALPEITFIPQGNMGNLTFGGFASIYAPNEQAMYEIKVDWSNLTTETSDSLKMYFYTFNTLDISELIPPPQEIVSFPKGSIVLAKKYGLNDDFAAYLRAAAIETTWNGSYFYGHPENLPTNISNGGLGFFSTCAVLSTTLIAE